MNHVPEKPGNDPGNKLPVKSGPVIGVLADDLTGALDAAVPFAARGFETLVSPSHELPKGAGSAEVVSINLGTRHMDPSEISERVSAAVGRFVELGVQIFLNKVDSTLRGNPGVELAATINALSVDHAVMCSAFPQNGRTIANCMLLVDGVPVADTDVGRDQLSPLPSSDVRDILDASLGRAGLEDRFEVRTEAAGDRRLVDRPVIVVPDAGSDDDLRILARRIVAAEAPALVAGSGGLANAIAEVLAEGCQEPEPGASDEQELGFLAGAGGILIVSASQRSIVDVQLAVLGRDGRFDLRLIELSVDEVLDGVDPDSSGDVSEVIANGGVAVLKLGKLGAGGDQLEPGELGATAQTLVNNLGRMVKTIVDAANPGALIVIGGDTASGVLGACRVSSIRLQDELQPGTVSGRPVDGSIAGSLLVTRAGGFGGKNSLLELVSLLKTGPIRAAGV